MKRRIAVYSGSFNPPCIHHRIIVAGLAREFDEVVVVPCGPRPDKPSTNDVSPVARAAMVDMTFSGMEKVRVELFDLEQASFSRAHNLVEMFSAQGEVWVVVGARLVQGGARGRSFIQEHWEKGREIWESLNYAVVVREDEVLDLDDLPPSHRLFRPPCRGASKAVREKVFHHQDISGLVTERVAAYIDRGWLYRGRNPVRSTALDIREPRLKIVFDERNSMARKMAGLFQRYESDDPNCICVFGGDGTMLRAIRRYWRMRLPFLGINAGHRGFLLNGCEGFEKGIFPGADLVVHQAPLLYVESTDCDGDTKRALAFNDAWIERASSQTAWIDVFVDGECRMKRLMGDGMLVATPAGSTAYARAMGATPLLIDTPALLLVGSNVMEPPAFKSALLSQDGVLRLVPVDPEKRPVAAFADGASLGLSRELMVRVSRIASAELAFCEGHDIVRKIAQLQFPG